ncbi:MAG: DUF4280 domain-containing protein [Desulfobacterales bacterium]|nr:DUF4280 domain-containing protein [Desulfobacterales bacterium]
MAEVVTGGAMLKCSFGAAPSSLMVLPANKVLESLPVANIMDMAPLMNILPFGMCNSMSNPVVAAATAAKLGVFSPMPCVPAIAGPWTPGAATVMVGSIPVVDKTSMLMCSWGGVIQVKKPGQESVKD